jgi:hypothetical protein
MSGACRDVVRRFGWRAALAAALAVLSAAPAAAEKRVALVIGNSAYKNVTPLDNPTRDAQLMAETLSGIGFTLVGGHAQLDLDKSAMDSAVQEFGRQVVGADVALFYYAGHGVQVAGSNYLVPVSANPTREADVDFQMVDANLVLRQMQGSGTRLNLVILDACRNNPFGSRGLRGSDGGLAQMRAPDGTLISYATQPGNVAQDGSDGHSPYTKALAATLKQPGLDIFQTFNQVGLAVKRATGGTQQPWVSSSPIDGTFYFVPPSMQVAAAPAPQEPLRVDPDRVPLKDAGSKPQDSKPQESEPRRTTSGGGSFDGAWVVLSVGCGGSSTNAVVVSSGRIIGEGIVSGRVSPGGAASAVGNAGNGVTVISSGHLSGRGGSGSFRRSDGCSGRWTASKQ